ncbi:hypothetical protein LPJ53_005792 [Coemansia erecta]|uniref:Thioesterase domain-containing protein n=1 Tax=Coemansia erecta TaxID=147472 RepID=A0A9W8CPF1_9FUNG|nr:hypothetical protein LPJ53_005792 [Coemansia erecta]
MPATPLRPIHQAIRQMIARHTDLLPVGFHALWDPPNPAQLVRSHLLAPRLLDLPQYYYSPSAHHLLGHWNFAQTSTSSHQQKQQQPPAIEETTLFTLLDDATAELSTRLMSAVPRDEPYIGFTVNLTIEKSADTRPAARSFYFDARTTLVKDRKVVIECPVYDTETAAKLLVARATFVFVPLASMKNRLADPSDPSRGSQAAGSGAGAVLSQLNATDACPLSPADLSSLSQPMNFMPKNTVPHKDGSVSLSAKRLVAMLDFDKDLSGPPIYVHGGLLGTVLYNASALLFTKVTGIASTAVDAIVRDINYHKGVDLESKGIIVDASVEAIDPKTNHVVIFAKLERNGKVHTTLKTTFAPKPRESKL